MITRKDGKNTVSLGIYFQVEQQTDVIILLGHEHKQTPT